MKLGFFACLLFAWSVYRFYQKNCVTAPAQPAVRAFVAKTVPMVRLAPLRTEATLRTIPIKIQPTGPGLVDEDEAPIPDDGVPGREPTAVMGYYLPTQSRGRIWKPWGG